jgi:rubrerythrin
MNKVSRRKFIYFFASLFFSYPLTVAAASSKKTQPEQAGEFPITINVLKAAHESEKLAAEHYTGYSQKALEEKYPNIAYLFSALAVSENIHAENYKQILISLNTQLEAPEFEIIISETKTNLIKAAEGELKKIEKTYPDILAKLKKESHDQAVVNCMYSWKSHRQHERKIGEIRKYSKTFFGSVAKKIEEMKLDFHVCEICGSTIDEVPNDPCEICNHPVLHYHNVRRPI